jgi:CBS domain-containing protein
MRDKPAYKSVLDYYLGKVEEMKVSDLVKKEPVCTTQASTIYDVCKLMSDNSIGLVVIVESDGPKKPVGVVSERDVIRAMAERRSLESPAWDIATKEVIKVHPDDDVGNAAMIMGIKGTRHLLVVDDSGRLEGVVSVRDIISEKSVISAITHAYFTEPLDKYSSTATAH